LQLYLSKCSNANVVFVESPIGVGFSYEDGVGPDDYRSDDDTTARDAHTFLVNFLKAHPQFIGRDTWLTGESYAGVYVPTLSHQIVSQTKQSPLAAQLAKQFKGVAVS
jgi:carboxypeptidase C (cathepsin A)